MSGMKFRVQCSSCGATFFSPDRKARICPKCAKKRQGSAPGPQAPPFGSEGARTKTDRTKLPAAPKLAVPMPKKPQRPPKASEITPEQLGRLEQIYRERFSGTDQPWLDMVKAISDDLWVTRKVVTSRLRKIVHPDIVLTPELKSEIIEKYKHFVEHGERPPEGRRKKIGIDLGVPLSQVRSVVYEWSQSQFKQSPTPELSRELRFEIEKLYWAEMDAQRIPLNDIPVKLADQLKNVSAYQVSRWLDTLHDDDARFATVPGVPPEIEQNIIEEYKKYLTAPTPPPNGLHSTIAETIAGVTRRQVHKTLQKYRNRRRAEYPLR